MVQTAKITLILMLILLGFVVLWKLTSQRSTVQRSPEFARIVPEDAEVQRIATGFKFTEGPAVDPDGNLFFTDLVRSQISKLTPGGELIKFRTDAQAGANGLMFDSQGRLLACEGGKGRVTRTELDGSITVLADEFNGKRFNQPNDLIIAQDGSVYFTDPFFGSGRKSQPVEGVYRIGPNGVVALVIEDMAAPNGIFLSQDGRTLYVADSEDQIVKAFAVQPDGSVTDDRLFAEMEGVPDGMTLDVEGNLYVTNAKEGVWVFNPTGTLLGIIPTPEGPSNVTFGGKTLYITAGTSVYAIGLNVTGTGIR